MRYSDGRSILHHRCRICGDLVLFDSELRHVAWHAQRGERFIEVRQVYDRDEVFRRWLAARH